MKFGSITTGIIADGLVFNMDAANRVSYVPDATINKNTINLSQTGSFINDTAFISPPISASCFSLDGTDAYISEQSTTEITSLGDSMTIQCFFKLTDNSDSYQAIVAKRQNWTAATNCYALWAGTAYSSKFRFYLSNGSSSDYAEVDSAYSTNTWYQVTGVYNGSKLLIYQNGVKQADETAMTGNVNEILTSELLLGISKASNSVSTSYIMTGLIANVHIYNRALSANEVLHNYNALKGRFGLT